MMTLVPSSTKRVNVRVEQNTRIAVVVVVVVLMEEEEKRRKSRCEGNM
jgi:hypothetical protein